MSDITEQLKELIEQRDEAVKDKLEAEAENAAFHLLVKSLLEDLKIAGWEDDYTSFMLQTITDSNKVVNDERPTIVEAYAISSLYASKLEGLCVDLTKIIDSEGSHMVTITQTMLAIYNDSYKSIMAKRPSASE